ncbi:sensor histidine kinase [Noviluteimonas gilva]|uniref:histidine kinase n=1 Tax=Noviluteimonas gilva TaxID=2682097 RepID=A0A7C9M2C0_9GAMM|nr:ATP-binding protein [Lysobacter gilvus]MUV13666.1 PAS domain-containing protein [Lysobacter gilvus]
MGQGIDPGTGRDHVVIRGVAFGQARAQGALFDPVHPPPRELLSSHERGRALALDQVRILLDAVPTAILLAGADGRVVLANSAAASLFGYSHDAMPHVFADTLVPAFDQGARELFATRADGSELPVDVECRTVVLGNATLSLLTVADATQRRRQEREATLQRDELAHLSRVAMLGELSGALAHEINQPLYAILCNAQAAQRLLRSDPPDLTEIRDIIDDIVVDDRRAGEVIQRLRKWLRKEHVDHVPLGLNGVVLDALHLVRADLLQRGVDVHLELAGELPHVAGDRIQLQQVVLNLVMNGCDAMEHTPAPRVLRIRTQEDNGCVRLEVIDRGKGIEPAIAQTMFDPFETTKPDGMGMGLAVCRTIVESHDGRVWAQSLDVGARVAFELPGLPA